MLLDIFQEVGGSLDVSQEVGHLLDPRSTATRAMGYMTSVRRPIESWTFGRPSHDRRLCPTARAPRTLRRCCDETMRGAPLI
jgi:hypothetical protein